MYNEIKVCKFCNWQRKYDTNRDHWHIDNYKYCPICGTILKNKNYSPDI